ncbi:MAG: Uma2 family endonuclease [Gemmatimonadaceae bacterium]|nr:Uma2 family endonuclease [Gemmatimonadaceae bacterium]
MKRTRAPRRKAAMIPAPMVMTADELLMLRMPDKRMELVRGRLVVREPAGFWHGDIAARVLVAISNYLTADRGTQTSGAARGRVVAAETGFTLQRNPDTVRAPDVAYICTERIPSAAHVGFADVAPDLAVEVLSPSDRPGEVLSKVADWLTAGTLLVWTIDPERRRARVYRADGSDVVLSADDYLDGEDVLPGFRASVSELVDRP